MVRWSLWAKGQGAISHESALDTHSIGEFSPSRVHRTVPARFSKVNSAIVLHRGELEDTDVQRREGYSVTTPVRSLIDVAAVGADLDQLGRAIAEARDAGLMTVRQLREQAEAVDVTAALRIEQALGRLGL